MILRLLFWNLNRNERLLRPLAELAREREIDLVITVEHPFDAREMRTILSDLTQSEFGVFTGNVNKRVAILSRDTVSVQAPIAESQYIVVHPVKIGPLELLIAAMHGISRLEDETLALNEGAIIAATLLRDAETDRKHRRTVLVGDFNLNPFDEGMAKARGFYGVMARSIAARAEQKVKFQDYPLFYNPMWSRLGDESTGPPGTFYRKQSSHLEYYWHTYDQVLLRPALIDAYDSSRLEVVTRTGEHELVRDGLPNSEDYSDHLPVLLGLDLSKIEG